MSGTDAITQLERLGELKSKGILTEAEFEIKKAELLSGSVPPLPLSAPLSTFSRPEALAQVPIDQKRWFVGLVMLGLYPLGLWLYCRKRIYIKKAYGWVPISVAQKWFVSILIFILLVVYVCLKVSGSTS